MTGWRAAAALVVAVNVFAYAGAQPATTAASDDPIARGFAQITAGAFDDAAQTFAQARLDASARGDAVGLGRVQWGLGDLAKARGDAAAAEALWRAAATTLRAARAWTSLGEMQSAHGLKAFDQRRYDVAEQLWRDALDAYEQAGDARRQATMLRNLTFLPGTPRADDIALLDRALPLAQRGGDVGTLGAVWHARADLRFADGDLAGAWDDLQQALTLLEQAGPSARLARARTSAGRLYRVLGRFQQARDLQLRNAELLEQLGDLPGAAQALDAAAYAALTGKQHEDAYRLARRAQAVAIRSGNVSSRVATGVRLAQALVAIGRGEEALAALAAIESDASTPGFQAVWHETQAMALIAMARPQAALDVIDRAPMGDDAPVEPRVLWHSRRAGVLRALGRGAEAAADSAHALTLLDVMATRLWGDDATKREYFDGLGELIDLHVRLLADAGRTSDALDAAERGRARAFADLLVSRVTGNPSTGRPGPARSAEPAVASPASVRAGTTAEAVAHAAAASSTLLAYWVSGEAVLTWVVRPDGTVRFARTSARPGELTRLAGVATGQGVAARRALRALHRLLIEPVRGWLPSHPDDVVTVIPHGPLFRVSFAALPDARGRYLVERHALHYAPSIATLAAIARPRGAVGAALLVADPASPARSPGTGGEAALPRLPAAANEARRLASLLGPRDVRLLTAGRATEASVRQALPGASVVHMATHGVISDDAPWSSFLALQAGGDDPSADGRLTAAELYDLRLSADLVVLAACSTAVGPPTGDGFVGLTRGFLAAGVPTVVASLWDLPDETTARLQPTFYTRWLRSGSPAAALRAAQIALLADLRAGRVRTRTVAGEMVVPEHPWVWAGLVAVGRP